LLDEVPLQCPHCGETISVLVDCSVPEQVYVEDCQVCCAPMLLWVSIDSDGQAMVIARRENE